MGEGAQVSNPTLTLTPTSPGGTVTSDQFSVIYNNVIDKVRLDATNDLGRVKGWINKSYMQLAVETRYFQTSGTATLTSGQAAYTLDPNLLGIDLITVTQPGGLAWFPLAECQLDEILNFQAVSPNTSGPPRRYCVLEQNTIIFWPTPGEADTVTFYYSYLPAPLVNDTDVPLVPTPYTLALEFGALVHAAEFKRDLMMLGDFQQQYAVWLAAFQRFANRKQGQYPETFPTWTRKLPYGPHDPSVDIPDTYYSWT